jgi:hypothetical protein
MHGSLWELHVVNAYEGRSCQPYGAREHGCCPGLENFDYISLLFSICAAAIVIATPCLKRLESSR